MTKIAEEVMRRDKVGAKSTMIVVAEGASHAPADNIAMPPRAENTASGGIAEIVGAEIAERTGKEVRTCVLGHLQRGGAPTALDRISGNPLRNQGCPAHHGEKFGTMVSYQNYLTLDVPISHAVNRLRRVDPEGQMVETLRGRQRFPSATDGARPKRCARRCVMWPDFPRPGILFKDITPILGNGISSAHGDGLLGGRLHRSKTSGRSWASTHADFSSGRRWPIGSESALCRSASEEKLPWKTETLAYKLRYGEAEMEVHVDAFRAG